ncbi:MAG: adenosylcobinamide-GDP ribazoletransferase [Candidatus Infernicultor aquiphilus]|uniref:Adenosylcobinamide-GDP ribazoletransferase n=1 Tax=Candidatus Infernicultor aquiphilus TaxID=1805029 RepID=A0A1J5GI52_9BACT|nr:adenosylcobinamide-GDP ribazoletransferase [bacterium]OIP71956.1 MAG: cobalamin 5'-phosphate synthase [Candidatus Atribacteria bacterium CG2_30_33_13]PIU24738.1 MAG: adenosylcobinamide-GDP ribazoletransferase [Candidatus Atribacteria bacterium CG08_land_8_20_14_0_20_33_29]PIW11168.1 MAG: adenosylcobinamide-GDP ribazoletransferase [Candidatus Atribacteria bacterium CG17_big_fil_post_rev_8_21_14_2_50_34_11]PIX33358.1 MAG: adenosylcobinamide-GDP ribazoletransferase [Candidatus Atribacteria bact
MKILRDLSLAIRFLTIIPIISFPPSDDTNQNEEALAEHLANSMAFFPLVGMLMGVLLVLLRRLFYYLPVSSLVGDTLVLIFWIWLSGGLHLDGFADSVDGFLGGHNKEEILKIMKDSSTGAKGVVALVSLLLLKFVLLVEMPLFLKDAALFFTPTIGRWSMVIAAFLGRPARLKNSMGKLFMDYVSWKEVIFASLTMAVIGILLFRLYFLPLVMVGIGLVLLILKYSQKKIGGISGDILGAINEIVEVFCLLVIYLSN